MSNQISVNWIKCTGDKWCDLLKLNLANPHFDNLEGVYIIWHDTHKPCTIKVGKGVIRERLQAHRSDNSILFFSDKILNVTWANVSKDYRDGVEKYLFDTLSPLVGERTPDISPIIVNLPW